MKASIEKELPVFKPVTVVLETQHEVDAIFAVLNCVKINRAIKMMSAWEVLDRFHGSGSFALHDNLMEIIR